jgi:isoamylase
VRPVFRRRKWFQGRPIMGEHADDIEWFTPDGATMTEQDWQVGYARSIGVFLNGNEILAIGTRGQRIVDDSFFAAFNAYEQPLEFLLPDGPYAEHWRVTLDTAKDDVDRAFPAEGRRAEAGQKLSIAGRSVMLLRAVAPA